MGWFDCVASRYGVQAQGATEVALTVVDALGYLDEIPVCVGYEIDGKVTRRLPHHPLSGKGQASAPGAAGLEVGRARHHKI